MTSTTTCISRCQFHIHGHSRDACQALPLCSTPGHRWVGLEVSAAWQLSGRRVKCLFALSLAPQVLSKSLGVAVTWLWVGEHSLPLSSPWGCEENGAAFFLSQRLTAFSHSSYNEPYSSCLPVLEMDGGQKGWGPVRPSFQKPQMGQLAAIDAIFGVFANISRQQEGQFHILFHLHYCFHRGGELV